MNQQEGTPKKFTTRAGRKKQELAQQALAINPHSTSTAGISNLAGGNQATVMDMDVDPGETTAAHSFKCQKDINNTSLESNSSLPSSSLPSSSLPRPRKKQTPSSSNSKPNTVNHTSNPQDRQTPMKGRIRNGRQLVLQNPSSVAQVPTSTAVLSSSTNEEPTNTGAKNANTRKAMVTAGYIVQPTKRAVKATAAKKDELSDIDDTSSEDTSLLDDPKDEDFEPDQSSGSDDEQSSDEGMPSDDSKDEDFEISALKPKSLASKKGTMGLKLQEKGKLSTQVASRSTNENGTSPKGIGKKVTAKKEATGGSEAVTSSPLPGLSKGATQNSPEGIDSDAKESARRQKGKHSSGALSSVSKNQDDDDRNEQLDQSVDELISSKGDRLLVQRPQKSQKAQLSKTSKKKKEDVLFDPTGYNEIKKQKFLNKIQNSRQNSEITFFQEQVEKLLGKLFNECRDTIGADDKQTIVNVISLLEKFPDNDNKQKINRILQPLLDEDIKDIATYERCATESIELVKRLPNNLDRILIEHSLSEFSKLRPLILFLRSKKILRGIVFWKEIAKIQLNKEIEILPKYKEALRKALTREINLAYKPDLSPQKAINNLDDSKNPFVSHDSQAAYQLFRLITNIVPELRQEHIILACSLDNMHFMRFVIRNSKGYLGKEKALLWNEEISGFQASELLNKAIQHKAKKISAHLAHCIYASNHPIIHGRGTLISEKRLKQSNSAFNHYFDTEEQFKLAIKQKLSGTVYAMMAGDAAQIMCRYNPNDTNISITDQHKVKLNLATDIVKSTIIDCVEGWIDKQILDQDLTDQVPEITLREYIRNQIDLILNTVNSIFLTQERFVGLGIVMLYILNPLQLQKILKKNKNDQYEIRASSVYTNYITECISKISNRDKESVDKGIKYILHSLLRTYSIKYILVKILNKKEYLNIINEAIEVIYPSIAQINKAVETLEQLGDNSKDSDSDSDSDSDEQSIDLIKNQTQKLLKNLCNCESKMHDNPNIKLYLEIKHILRTIIANVNTLKACKAIDDDFVIQPLYKKLLSQSIKREIILANDPDFDETMYKGDFENQFNYNKDITLDSEAIYYLFRLITKIIPEQRKEYITLACFLDNNYFMNLVINASIQKKKDREKSLSWDKEISGFTQYDLLELAIQHKAKKILDCLANHIYMSNHLVIYGVGTLISHSRAQENNSIEVKKIDPKKYLFLSIKNQLLNTVCFIISGGVSQVLFRYDPNDQKCKIANKDKKKLELLTNTIINAIIALVESSIGTTEELDEDLPEQTPTITHRKYIENQLNLQFKIKKGCFNVEQGFTVAGLLIGHIMHPLLRDKIFKKNKNNQYEVKGPINSKKTTKLIEQLITKNQQTIDIGLKKITWSTSHGLSLFARYVIGKILNTPSYLEAIRQAIQLILQDPNKTGPIAQLIAQEKKNLSDQMKDFLHTWVDFRIEGKDLVTGKFVNNEKISETNDIILLSKQNPNIPKVHLKDPIYSLLQEIQLDKDYVQQTITEDTKHILLPLLAQVNLDNEKKYFNETQDELDRKIKTLQEVLIIEAISKKKSVENEIASLKKQRNCISNASPIYKKLVKDFYNESNINSTQLKNIKGAVVSSNETGTVYAPLNYAYAALLYKLYKQQDPKYKQQDHESILEWLATELKSIPKYLDSAIESRYGIAAYLKATLQIVGVDHIIQENAKAGIDDLAAALHYYNVKIVDSDGIPFEQKIYCYVAKSDFIDYVSSKNDASLFQSVKQNFQSASSIAEANFLLGVLYAEAHENIQKTFDCFNQAESKGYTSEKLEYYLKIMKPLVESSQVLKVIAMQELKDFADTHKEDKEYANLLFTLGEIYANSKIIGSNMEHSITSFYAAMKLGKLDAQNKILEVLKDLDYEKCKKTLQTFGNVPDGIKADILDWKFHIQYGKVRSEYEQSNSEQEQSDNPFAQYIQENAKLNSSVQDSIADSSSPMEEGSPTGTFGIFSPLD